MDAQSPLPLINKFDTFFKTLKDHWTKALTDTVNKIFTDPEVLMSFIGNGQTFLDELEDDPYDMINNVTRAMASFIHCPFCSVQTLTLSVSLFRQQWRSQLLGAPHPSR